MGSNNDEYIDYSCSTPLERLARDIETALRNWQLFENDRHVHVHNSNTTEQMKDGDHTQTATMGRKRSNLNSNLKQRNASRDSLASQNSKSSKNSAQEQQAQAQGVKLIRSQEFKFNGSKLMLSLWDGPEPEHHPNSQHTAMTLTDIPYSLHRVQGKLSKNTRKEFTLNLSTLFGINQHITLDYRGRSTTSGILYTLQSALNLATQACGCRIPAFAMCAYPHSSTWLLQSTCYHSVPTNILMQMQSFESYHLNGYCNPGSAWNAPIISFRAQLCGGAVPQHCRSIDGLATLFLSHCNLHGTGGGIDERDFILSFVRHHYVWKRNEGLRFRRPSFTSLSELGAPGVDDPNVYSSKRNSSGMVLQGGHQRGESLLSRATRVLNKEGQTSKAIKHAMYLIEGTKKNMNIPQWKRDLVAPLWGPVEDPLLSASVTVQWNEEETASFLSMRSSIDEKMFFNPVMVQNAFLLNVKWDDGVACNTFGLSLRCILAAYVKARTLDQGLLLIHLTSPQVIEELAYSEVELSSSLTDSLDETTRSLVEAMDFDEGLPDQDLLDDIVDEVFSDFEAYPSESYKNSANAGTFNFKYSAPAGRLFSVIAMRMSKMKTPIAMSGLWLAFTELMRIKYDIYENLPNLGRVDAIDGKLVKHGSKGSVQHEPDFSAFINCSEPNPDLSSCIINQKLQAFNVCIENMVTSTRHNVSLSRDHCDDPNKLETVLETEEFKEEQATRPVLRQIQDELPGTLCSPDSSVSEDAIGEIQEEDEKEDGVTDEEIIQAGFCPAKKTETEFFDMPSEENVVQEGFMPLEPKETEFFDTPSSELITNEGFAPFQNRETEFFDADEDELSFGSGSSSNASNESHPPPQIQSSAKAFWTAEKKKIRNNLLRRKGARCPVKNMSLCETGDQLYAPYLQRTAPVTIDTIEEQKAITSKSPINDVQTRIEIANRIQRPKLLSDMCSFKAANRNADFEDFVSWYGNPKIDQFVEISCANSPDAMTAFAALDAASEAVEFLTATRDFWADTWLVATPKPAEEQHPLFDGSEEIEKILHYFEMMHPAHLINQVLAVNFTNANFILRSTAGPAMKIPCIQRSFATLEELLWKALRLLNDEMIADFAGVLEKREENNSLSPEVLAVCEDVCDCISAIETLLAHATSLMTAFPGALDIVELVLMNMNQDIPVDSIESRTSIFRAILKQQHAKDGEQQEQFKLMKNMSKSDGDLNCPNPAAREYVFRSLVGKLPSRLFAQVGETDEAFGHTVIGKGVLLAFTKSFME